jgi:hypothetical protein
MLVSTPTFFKSLSELYYLDVNLIKNKYIYYLPEVNCLPSRDAIIRVLCP